MQRSLCIISLLLFLGLLFNIVFVFCLHSDFGNSVLSDSLTTCDSVMAPKIPFSRTKKFLEEHHDEGDNAETRMEEVCKGQSSLASISRGESTFSTRRTDYKIRSRRWKQTSESVIVTKDQCTQSEEVSNNLHEHRSKRIRSNQKGQTVVESENLFTNGNSDTYGQCSYSYGQASYQRSREGSIVKYEDSGDNVYACKHCNASFWFGEAVKRSSPNAPLIYTNCCKKGQIKLQDPKPTPTVLEKLLDPNNGSESLLFRENIRIYNSMFSFTSMGATIDRKINTGSGPYVFKISGQVHHLMGSILPVDGECPKYAQLYIYDTKNEILNRINAIDSTHVNQTIKPDIVQKLIKMFDETNELVKEFRTIRDKFENRCLPSLNMNILNRQSIDSKQYEEPTTEDIGGLIVGDIGEHDSNKDIIIESNNGQLRRVSRIHPKYM